MEFTTKNLAHVMLCPLCLWPDVHNSLNSQGKFLQEPFNKGHACVTKFTHTQEWCFYGTSLLSSTLHIVYCLGMFGAPPHLHKFQQIVIKYLNEIWRQLILFAASFLAGIILTLNNYSKSLIFCWNSKNYSKCNLNSWMQEILLIWGMHTKFMMKLSNISSPENWFYFG